MATTFTVSCEPPVPPVSQEDQQKVRRALHHLGKGLRSGYDSAKKKIDSVDWDEALDRSARAVEDVTDPAPRSEPDRWWERADEGVECKASTCTFEPWFSEAARHYPQRLRGDVKVFTSPDSDGWLVDWIRPGSVAETLGFRSGDVVQTVGGHALTDSWARVRALQALETAKTVRVVYRREGEILTLKLVF